MKRALLFLIPATLTMVLAACSRRPPCTYGRPPEAIRGDEMESGHLAQVLSLVAAQLPNSKVCRVERRLSLPLCDRYVATVECDFRYTDGFFYEYTTLTFEAPKPDKSQPGEAKPVVYRQCGRAAPSPWKYAWLLPEQVEVLADRQVTPQEFEAIIAELRAGRKLRLSHRSDRETGHVDSRDLVKTGLFIRWTNGKITIRTQGASYPVEFTNGRCIIGVGSAWVG